MNINHKSDPEETLFLKSYPPIKLLNLPMKKDNSRGKSKQKQKANLL